MEDALPIIRRIVKIAIWVVIYFLFCPLARSKGRSAFGWWLVGMLVFTLPVFAGYVVAVTILVEFEANAFVRFLAVYSVEFGAILGGFLVAAARGKLASLPDRDWGGPLPPRPPSSDGFPTG